MWFRISPPERGDLADLRDLLGQRSSTDTDRQVLAKVGYLAGPSLDKLGIGARRSKSPQPKPKSHPYKIPSRTLMKQ